MWPQATVLHVVDTERPAESSGMVPYDTESVFFVDQQVGTAASFEDQNKNDYGSDRQKKQLFGRNASII